MAGTSEDLEHLPEWGRSPGLDQRSHNVEWCTDQEHETGPFAIGPSIVCIPS